MILSLRNILLLIAAAAFISGSCTGRRSKAEHKNLIPENELVNLLIDVHLADGLLSMPGILYKYSYDDSLSSYKDVIESHGYSKDQMDRTIRYYFVKRPKKLVKIYDRVLGNLSEMDSRLDKDIPGFRATAQNLWTGRSFYVKPGPSAYGPESLDFPMIFSESFYLKYTLTLFPDDETDFPRADLYLSHVDTSGREQITYFTGPPYIKDGKPHTYVVKLAHKLPPPVRLKGWFINLDGLEPNVWQNYIIGNITLSLYPIHE